MANLYGYISSNSQNRQLGERFGVAVTFINKAGPMASTLYVSSTFDCWDSQNNHIVAGYQILLTQTHNNGGVQVRYMMATGTGQTITVPGTYRYVFSVKTSDGELTTFEQTAIINANP
jgi:hypothetical protein